MTSRTYRTLVLELRSVVDIPTLNSFEHKIEGAGPAKLCGPTAG
jgi:hypothetical protein